MNPTQNQEYLYTNYWGHTNSKHLYYLIQSLILQMLKHTKKSLLTKGS